MIMVNDKTRELFVYDMIGPSWLGMDAGDTMVEALAMLGSGPVSVRLNSPGGDVFEGFAMYNALERHDGEVTTYNDGLVASAATFPFLAGKKRVVGKLSQTMIHEASTFTRGTGDDLRKAADLLDKINSQLADLYAEVSGKDKDEILAMMKKETWMDSAEATAMKFATSDDQPATTADTRIVPAGMYRNTPEAYLKPQIRLQAVKQRPIPDKFDAERKRKILDLTGIDLRVE